MKSILIIALASEFMHCASSEDLRRILVSYGYHADTFKITTIRDERLINTACEHYDIIVTFNKLRSTFPSVGKNKVFVTWLQDAVVSFGSDQMAECWNNHTEDWIIGYTQQLHPFGYNKNRLVEMPFIVNTEKMKSRVPHISEKSKLVLVGNKGFSTDDYFKLMYRDNLKSMGFTEESVMLPAKMLENDYYTNELVIHNKESLFDYFIQNSSDFANIYSSLPPSSRERTSIILEWWINELIYRQTIMMWILDFYNKIDITKNNAPIIIYGNGWEQNSLFKKYARGFLKHSEIGTAYRNANFALHLNHLETYHHRPMEILCAGGTVLTRNSTMMDDVKLPTKIFDSHTFGILQDSLVSKVFNKIIYGDDYIKENWNSYLFDFYPFSFSFKNKKGLNELLLNYLPLETKN